MIAMQEAERYSISLLEIVHLYNFFYALIIIKGDNFRDYSA